MPPLPTVQSNQSKVSTVSAPDPKMGEGVAIGLAIGVTLTIAVFVGLYSGAASGVTATPGILKQIIQYFPYILLMFGIIADLFTLSGVYSIPTILGLLSIPLNSLASVWWTGLIKIFDEVLRFVTLQNQNAQLSIGSLFGTSFPTPPVANQARMAAQRAGALLSANGADLFESMTSPYAPQNLVITATIMSYYLYDVSMNRNFLDAIGILGSFVLFYAAQYFGTEFGSTDASKSAQAIMALLEGMLFGGCGYIAVQVASDGKQLPSAVLPGSGFDGYLREKK